MLSITAAEVAEATGRPVEEVERRLDDAVASGEIGREGNTYRSPAGVSA